MDCAEREAPRAPGAALHQGAQAVRKPAEREIAAGRGAKIAANVAKLRERNQRARRIMDFPEYAVGGFRII